MKLTCVAMILAAVLSAAVYPAPSFAGETGTEVSFETSDGFVIKATYTEGDAGAPLVLLLHQLGSDRDEYGALSRELVALGMHVLVPDARGHGESVMQNDEEHYWDEFSDEEFALMRLDIVAALGYARADLGLVDNGLGIVGASIQSSTALLYAETDDKVDALVLLSPGLSYRGIDTLGPMESYSGRPVFMAASKGDSRSFVAVKELARYVGPDSGYWTVDGNSHGVSMLDDDPLLMKGIVDWLVINLSPDR